MVVVGVLLVLVGVALLVAEAHVPAGVLGAAGGLALAGGAALAIAGAGGGIAVVLPVALTIGAIACIWLAVATRKGLASRRLSLRAGSEALSGRMGGVRNWAGEDGGGRVDGAVGRGGPRSALGE